MDITVYCLNAFAKNPSGGNPAGVVLEAPKELTDPAMQNIASIVGFSETAFVLPSSQADFNVRFFTPEGEVDLCGHATIATFSLMYQNGLLKPGHYTQETKAGILKLDIQNDGTIFMAQNAPQFFEILTPEEITDCLQIPIGYLQKNLPIQVVSTGLRDILVPINTLPQLQSIQPDFEKVTELSKKYAVIGIHLFTLETLNGATAHCRNLAPLYGIPEESATGTSNGALSCYLYQYQQLNPTSCEQLKFEQGYSMHKPSEILAKLQVQEQQIQAIWVGSIAEADGIKTVSLN